MISYMDFPLEQWCKIKSTNSLEKLN
ncbi:MAG: hypothetical protein LHW47_06300 [Candidatus Cloacimonetes bacterium]|nr:hypothetical protein [Candidatus Cloacimonadota bacterium]